jgi:aldehyde:ferredoxin oxidoreductase
MNGYAGNILRLDLTNRKISTIPTSDYEQWGGGHGIGSAIFFDLVKDKTIGGLDPANVVTLMTSPLCGTIAPAAGGRTEVQGIGIQSYPIGWFTRSNFGGRFSAQLKYAGWDGVVLEGKADEPVWIDIRDDDVQIRNCLALSLWGTGTQDCQQTIWSYVAGNGSYGDWIEPTGKDGGQTTQRPAVVAIGPAGENQTSMGCLMHDAGNSSGQGGFGGVFGSKNLKAISAIGTGSIHIHDPKALMQARLWQKQNYAFNLEGRAWGSHGSFEGAPAPLEMYQMGRRRDPSPPRRPQACVGCHSGCRGRYKDGVANEATCVNSWFYIAGKDAKIQRAAADLINEYGLNAYEVAWGLYYLNSLNSSGAFGPDTELDCPLDFDDYGSLEFLEHFFKMISYRNDGRGNPSQFGDGLAGGFVRAAKKWGRLDGDPGAPEDLLNNFFPFWGLPLHYDPRVHPDWGYGSLLGDRDINEHCLVSLRRGRPEDVARIYTDKMVPFEGDERMLDYADDNMYSERIAKLVSWHRYYTRFYKQSLLFCDSRWPDMYNPHRPDNVGSTGEAEPKFLKAVTGKEITFLEGIELGKKIWNLDHAIWTLQGRHRDMVHFSDSMYNNPTGLTGGPSGGVLTIKDGKWGLLEGSRHLDRERVEDFKTLFYDLQGWDAASGFPRRSTLAGMGLAYVADELEAQGKLGA